MGGTSDWDGWHLCSWVTRERLVILDYELPARPRWVRRLLISGVALFESAYFPRFAGEGVAPLLAELGLEKAERRGLGPSFAVRSVDLSATDRSRRPRRR